MKKRTRVIGIVASLFVLVILVGLVSISRWSSEEKALALVSNEAVSNDRSYEWYTDQKYTGTYSQINCGPTSATMAIKWHDESFKETVEEARKTYKKGGGWWSTGDIINYLKKHDVRYQVVGNIKEEDIVKLINKGHIAIACIDTSKLQYHFSLKDRLGRFYNYQGGHFLIIKGYKMIEGDLYFECYDPNSWGMTFENGEPMGKNRYYKSSELLESIKVHWNRLIIVKDER